MMKRLIICCLATLQCALALASSQEMQVTASAYNSTPKQTDRLPHEAAWGDRIEPGMKVIAVSPDLIKAGLTRGTEVEIVGLDGKWTVLDRTGSHHRKRIDIYMGLDVKAAREWGLRKVVIRWPASITDADGSTSSSENR